MLVIKVITVNTVTLKKLKTTNFVFIFQNIMDTCSICKGTLSDGRETVKIGEKGARNINCCREKRNDSILVKNGDVLHKDCRRDYTNTKSIKSVEKKNSDPKTPNRALRSKEQFAYKENCLFCGLEATIRDTRRGVETYPVRTNGFQKNIEGICKERNDEWATEVFARIQFVHDLHAADTVYHQQCSVNFRTGKNKPSGTPNEKRKYTGRPQNEETKKAFQQTLEYLDEHEDDQITITDLVNKMSEFCGDLAYTSVHMKSKILNHFGENVIITEINGRPNVITLRKTAKAILQDFHQSQQNHSDPEIEKNNIIKAAGNFIKADIKTIKSIIKSN